MSQNQARLMPQRTRLSQTRTLKKTNDPKEREPNLTVFGSITILDGCELQGNWPGIRRLVRNSQKHNIVNIWATTRSSIQNLRTNRGTQKLSITGL